MDKKSKMKLIKFIQEVVKREVQQRLEEQRTEIISEVVNLLETRTFNENENGYETDDPVLQRVLEKNQQQDNKRDVVEETIQNTQSRDTETIQEQIRSLQQQVSQMNQQNVSSQPHAPQQQTQNTGSAVDPNQVRQKFLQAQKQAQTEMNVGGQGSDQTPSVNQKPQPTPSHQQNVGNQTRPVNHNDPNVPDYLQNVANRDYSELVERFGD